MPPSRTVRALAALVALLAGALAFANDPPPILVSAPSYALTVPITHLHPGNTFSLVVFIHNDSDRPILAWSDDIADLIEAATDGYVTVTSGPLSALEAIEVEAGAQSVPITFGVSVADYLPYGELERAWGLSFTIQVEGVLEP